MCAIRVLSELREERKVRAAALLTLAVRVFGVLLGPDQQDVEHRGPCRVLLEEVHRGVGAVDVLVDLLLQLRVQEVLRPGGEGVVGVCMCVCV